MSHKFKDQFNWTLLGIPDHAGVMNVGGRIGAAGGPLAFRRVFCRLKGRIPVQDTLLDQGDVAGMGGWGGQVAENHRKASDRVREAHPRGSVSVVVGGGHDHGFSHLRGIAEAFPGKTVGCINIDAHLDVRSSDPVITSGSPFYLALESGVLKPQNFVEFGIQSHCNAPELWDYVDSKKIQVVVCKATLEFKSALNRLAIDCDVIVVSLDLDALAQAYAPGVSAPQAEGFTSNEIIEMMESAGHHEKVVSLGVFELNPLLDLDDRTARIAATAAWHFVESRILASGSSKV
jgi:formiminoglutamase